ncbi:SNF2 family N-terminal domain-containing protein [Cercophora scortea]|uniref:SNF2 family N-terminal domain-containing protein n=1 Tax=Cercophora scortea TaxID=314031 RepID=A0AAE0IGH1_9PEZI|nr:SNF2 family N-terminal domain-containing protein [Cercophora scortea]
MKSETEDPGTTGSTEISAGKTKASDRNGMLNEDLNNTQNSEAQSDTPKVKEEAQSNILTESEILNQVTQPQEHQDTIASGSNNAPITEHSQDSHPRPESAKEGPGVSFQSDGNPESDESHALHGTIDIAETHNGQGPSDHPLQPAQTHLVDQNGASDEVGSDSGDSLFVGNGRSDPEDDDDDIKVIGFHSVSNKAKERFGMHQFNNGKPVTEPDVSITEVRIKAEPNDDPEPESDRSDSDFVMDDDGQLSDGEDSPVPKRQKQSDKRTGRQIARAISPSPTILDRTQGLDAQQNSAKKRNRNGQAQPKTGRPAKKPKLTGTRKSARNAREATRIMLQMLHQNPVGTGQQMADFPVLSGIEASTVAAQTLKLKALLEKDPNADTRRINGDITMLTRARVALGRKNWAIDGEKYEITDINTPLLAYQFARVGWMLERKRSKNGVKGGILADAMGLGKTVEMLACIIGNRPSENDLEAGWKRTLIVAPANAVHQWVKEAWRHCEKKSKESEQEITNIPAVQYRSSDKSNLHVVEQSPIWITSYEEVSNQFPSDEYLRRVTGEHLNDRKCEEIRPQYMGPLFQMKFYRLVLDEGHAIKNYRSQRFKACVRLNAKLRWCLTGTPVHNRLMEIYPYMNFLRAPNSSSIDEFKKHYKIKESLIPSEGEGLALLLQEVMMKRTMTTKFCGYALFELPKAHVLEPVWANLSREETLIYRKVEEKVRRRLVRELRGGKTNNWLHYALRLRQAVSHPYLLESMMRKSFSGAEIQWLMEELAKIQTETPLWHQVGRWCEEELQMRSAEEFESEDLGDTHFDAAFDILPQLELIARNKTAEDGVCIRCGLPPEDPFVPEPSSQKKEKLSFLADRDNDILNSPTPSTKMTVLTNLVLEWRRRNPEDKIIVFTQFVLNGRIFGRMLQDEKIGFLYFFGSMSQPEKQKAIEDFETREDVHVLVASLLCTSQALNLSCANRVISLDLWWNYSLEQQAFGRVYRMGQVKETHFARIMVKSTIDERLSNLQEAKLRMINQTIKDHDSSKVTLTTEEAIGLFGRAVRDEEGKIIRIESDYEDEDDDDQSGEGDGASVADSEDTVAGSSDGSD